MKLELNNLSYAETLEHVSDLVMNTGALVVDMCDAPGYPSLMVLVKDCMPVFLFCRPDRVESPVWAAAKVIVENKLASVNAPWFDITEDFDLDWLLGEILNRTKGGEIKKPEQKVAPTAEQQGFEFNEPEQATPALSAEQRKKFLS